MHACKLLVKIQGHFMQEVSGSLNRKPGLVVLLRKNKAATIIMDTIMIIHMDMVAMAAIACRSPVRGQKTGLSRMTRMQVLLTAIVNRHTL